MQIRIAQFEGPLFLLLTLIEQQKLDISNISLTKITDQYLDFIRQNKEINSAELVAFIEIASQLIMLKSRVLLPYLSSIAPVDDDLQNNLVEKLKIYQHYLELAKIVHRAWCNQRKTSLNTVVNPQQIIPFAQQNNFFVKYISPHLLSHAMKRILKKHSWYGQTNMIVKKRLNIQEKIQQLIHYIKQKEQCLFSELIAKQTAREALIVTLLALLELSKLGLVYLNQETRLEDFVIKKIK